MSNEQLSTKIALLDQQTKIIMEQFKQYSEENSKQHDEVKKLIADMRVEIKESLDSKAGKWVEKLWIWLGIAVGSGVLGYVGLQLIKVIEKVK